MAADPRLPPTVPPMLASPGQVPEGAGWAYEMKWDGVRAVVAVGDGQVRAISRNNKDITAGYPELIALPGQVAGRRMLLDGELVALDPSGRPSFPLLQQRMHVRFPDRRLVDRVPVFYYLFDLLYLDGTATTDRTYRRRRDLLESLPLGAGPASVPPRFSGDGHTVLATAREYGLEGVVAKRVDSRYEPGRRSRNWIKTPITLTTEVVLGGWKPGAGRRAGRIGSLLLGAYDDTGRLRYIGHVGTGFTEAALRHLAGVLAPLERPDSPFGQPVPREFARDAHWIDPVLVGEVVYRSMTPDHRLRHPSWRGLRPDKRPEEITRDFL
ncbi:MAG TPA: non-homologous end-joining DNA ligase [Micromonosporaceae bacterium]